MIRLIFIAVLLSGCAPKAERYMTMFITNCRHSEFTAHVQEDRLSDEFIGECGRAKEPTHYHYTLPGATPDGAEVK